MILRFLLAAIALSAASTPALASDIRVVDGAIHMILDSAAPELTCVVVTSSGVADVDDAACERASASNARHPDTIPKGTYFFGNAERQPVECRNDTGVDLPEGFDRACADLVQRMQRARFVRAIRPQLWLAQAAFTGFTGPPGTLSMRVGVGANGRPTYCLLTTRSGNRTFDGVFCTIIRKRARFEPALNSEGQPTPSIYHHRFRLADR